MYISINFQVVTSECYPIDVTVPLSSKAQSRNKRSCPGCISATSIDDPHVVNATHFAVSEWSSRSNSEFLPVSIIWAGTQVK